MRLMVSAGICGQPHSQTTFLLEGVWEQGLHLVLAFCQMLTVFKELYAADQEIFTFKNNSHEKFCGVRFLRFVQSEQFF